MNHERPSFTLCLCGKGCLLFFSSALTAALGNLDEEFEDLQSDTFSFPTLVNLEIWCFFHQGETLLFKWQSKKKSTHLLCSVVMVICNARSTEVRQSLLRRRSLSLPLNTGICVISMWHTMTSCECSFPALNKTNSSMITTLTPLCQNEPLSPPDVHCWRTDQTILSTFVWICWFVGFFLFCLFCFFVCIKFATMCASSLN